MLPILASFFSDIKRKAFVYLIMRKKILLYLRKVIAF
jgi:hypothetical protein